MEGCGRLCPSLGTQGPHFLGIHCSPRIFVMSLSHVNSPKDSGLDSRPERIRGNFSFLPCHVHSSRVHEPLCSLQGKHEGKQTLKRCAGQDAPTVQEGAGGRRRHEAPFHGNDQDARPPWFSPNHWSRDVSGTEMSEILWRSNRTGRFLGLAV